MNRALRWLNLAYNSIGDKGAAAIGRALDSNGRLRTLNLAHTGVGPVAAMVIAEGMRENYALDVLNVSGNPVGFLGGRALMRVLNTSRRPRTLLMNDVAFDVSAAGGFDSDSPAGKYVLDIDDPGDWMVARALVSATRSRSRASSGPSGAPSRPRRCWTRTTITLRSRFGGRGALSRLF